MAVKTVYTFNQVLDGSYYVRVVNETVNSTRVGSDGTELGVQTFRTNGTTAVTNEVGGHNPSLADGVANAGTETLDITNYKLSGGAIVQTLQPITLAGANLSGVDFGLTSIRLLIPMTVGKVHSVNLFSIVICQEIAVQHRLYLQV